MADVAPPVIEDDFDEDVGEDVPVEPQGHPDQVYNAHLSVGNFFALYGWYIAFGLLILSIIWKNAEEKIEQLRRQWEDAKIKKDPDAYHRQEETRFSRLEQLQAKYDQLAMKRKEREEEIAAARRERDEAALQHRGKESMNRWRQEKEGTQNQTESKEEIKKTKKPTTFRRAEYNPLMGAGGGSGFKSSRAKPSRGG